MRKPGPQSETFQGGGHGFPQRPARVADSLIGLGVALFLVAALGAAVAVALEAVLLPRNP